MKHKLFSLITVSTMLLSLTACSAAPAETTAPETAIGATTVPETTVPETTVPETIAFQETIILDNENCTFKIVSIDEEALWGYTLKVYLENKTDLELTFSVDDVSVNGFMCDPFWAASVSSGMKANEEISFSTEDFDRNGISQVTDITFTLNVYNSNDLTADYLVSEEFTIYPQGQDALVPYVRTAQEGEMILFDNDYCTMIVTGYDPDNLWGYTVNVYLENKTDTSMMFSAENVSVNGFMCDPFWAATIAPGKRSNTTISWMESDFEDNGITEVESISLPIRVYDDTDWLREDFVSETFVLEP